MAKVVNAVFNSAEIAKVVNAVLNSADTKCRGADRFGVGDYALWF